MTADLLNAFKKPEIIREISHKKEILFLGSCFSEHIASKMAWAGFRNLSNPFGTVFHPVPLAKFVTDAFGEINNERIIQREDVFLSLDASGNIYGMSESLLNEKLKALRNDFRDRVKNASTLIITFGSAHGYRFINDGLIAANCHKIPSAEFNKELTEIPVMLTAWQSAIHLLKKENPELQVIFTVSPVRYKRDGWIENNRSKARLTELCALLEASESSLYFPAFEIVNDILRDYRYFEKDGVHPNGLAVDEVWEVFSDWFFSNETKKLIEEVRRLRQMENHRLLYPEAVSSEKFREKLVSERSDFLDANPWIIW